jgi:hypothetical protein
MVEHRIIVMLALLLMRADSRTALSRDSAEEATSGMAAVTPFALSKEAAWI